MNRGDRGFENVDWEGLRVATTIKQRFKFSSPQVVYNEYLDSQNVEVIAYGSLVYLDTLRMVDAKSMKLSDIRGEVLIGVFSYPSNLFSNKKIWLPVGKWNRYLSDGGDLFKWVFHDGEKPVIPQEICSDNTLKSEYYKEMDASYGKYS